LQALITEQRCEANALTDIDHGVAIAYLDGTLGLANTALLKFGEIGDEQFETLDIFTLLDRFRTDVFDEPAIAVRRVCRQGSTTKANSISMSATKSSVCGSRFFVGITLNPSD
jgi:hypothetical protein